MRYTLPIYRQRMHGANSTLPLPRSNLGMRSEADHGCTGNIGPRSGFGWKPRGRRQSVLSLKAAIVTNRTTQKIVRFMSGFSLPGFDLPQPPGEYRVDQDEEPIEVASRLAWRRVATFIHLPAIATTGTTQQMVPIDPAFLEAALEQDQKQS